MDTNTAAKRGYLNDNFRLFHLSDTTSTTIDYHYHEFQKVILFISGNVTYMIEGKSYQLMPWDILLVNHHEIHRPIIKDDAPYERIILWINPKLLEQPSLITYELNQCFTSITERRSHLLRVNTQNRFRFFSLLKELEANMSSKEFGTELYSYTIFLQAMITLNRLFTQSSQTDIASSVQSNQIVDQMIDYINHNLSTDLSIDTLSKKLFLSSSYLMHQFKESTGSSLHSYITRKRLSYALELLRAGTPITTVSEQAGYTDYSTFLRNFRRVYHCTPSQYLEGTTKVSPFPEKVTKE